MLLLVAVALSSCREVSRHRALRDLWTYIDAAPDSALRVLEALPSEHFLLPGDRADYALLKSIALDKNYIDVTDDSLARVATDWYDVHGRPERKLRAWYYLGRVQQNAGNPSGAIVSFQKAKQLAEASGDLFYEGMACRAMGFVYHHAYYKDEALSNMRHAHACFIASGHKNHANYAMLDVAEMLCAAGKYEESDTLLSRLTERLTSSDKQLSRMVSIVQGTCAYNRGKYEEAISLLRHAERSSPGGLLSGALGTLADAYAKMGNRDSSQYYLSAAFGKSLTAENKISTTFVRYQIEKSEGDYFAAMQDASRVMFGQDSVFRIVLNQSVVAAQRDAYKDSYQKEVYNNRIMKGGIFLSAIILCLVTAFIFLYIKKIRTDRENTIYQITSLRDEIQRMTILSSEKDQMIARLFQNHLHLVNDFSDTYLGQEDGQPDSEKRIIQHIQKQIDSLTSDNSFLQELESIVNYTCENVMELLRKEVKLKTNQYELLCCFFAGLSGNATRLLSGETRSNIYTSKHRLQATIRQQNPPHLSLFLKYLSS